MDRKLHHSLHHGWLCILNRPCLRSYACSPPGTGKDRVIGRRRKSVRPSQMQSEGSKTLMDRRNFLEAILVSPTAVPLLEQSTQNANLPDASQNVHGLGPRVRHSFNAGWLFERQSKGTGALGSFDRENGAAAEVEPGFREAYRSAYDDSEWAAIDLPHTWNAHDVSGTGPGYWRGIGWYRKHFRLDTTLSQKRVFLEFEGVNSVSEFWLNGEKIGRHAGGYTSFEFDVTSQARFGLEKNVLTVKVDNLFHGTV